MLPEIAKVDRTEEILDVTIEELAKRPSMKGTRTAQSLPAVSVWG
jgi:hypothetical protein